MRSAPLNVNPKPRPTSSPNEVLHYSEEHKKLIVELAEAVRDLSALLREIVFLIAAHERQKQYQ
jgi:hypothetical protein